MSSALITTRPDAVRTAAAIFEADWTRGPEPDPAPLVVSPTNARAQLLGLIRGATSSLDVYAEVLADREVLAALADAARRGVQVRLIVSPSPDNANARAALAAAGVQIRLPSALYVHAKLIVGAMALAPSSVRRTSLPPRSIRIVNWASSSTIRSALARLTRTFNLDFSCQLKRRQSHDRPGLQRKSVYRCLRSRTI